MLVEATGNEKLASQKKSVSVRWENQVLVLRVANVLNSEKGGGAIHINWEEAVKEVGELKDAFFSEMKKICQDVSIKCLKNEIW